VLGTLEIGSHKLFASPDPVFLISASQVARITGLSHGCLVIVKSRA
jgi:hypothetical protein